MQHSLALQHNNNSQHISIAAITSALANSSTTFGQITYVTEVAPAAKNKGTVLKKAVTANVQLFANIKQATSVYKNAVEKNASVKDFTVSDTYYTHNPNCYSLVEHNKTGQQYLYCIYNSVAATTYYVDDVAVSKADFASYLTDGAAEKLMSGSKSTHNVTNNVTHSIVVRTIKVDNVVALNVNKTQLAAAPAQQTSKAQGLAALRTLDADMADMY